jgi:sigma-B regulation protein RsbU (phosphoserine phosphatase)
MKILIAEDEPVTRAKLETLLQKWGYGVVTARDGAEAWLTLQADPDVEMVITDFQMPGLNGDELCRKARASLRQRSLYMILLTAVKVRREDLISGLLAGADDYAHKPFDNAELNARLQVGQRVVGLQNELRQRVKDLEDAVVQIKQLQGLLPICSYCKRIRDDQNYWHQVEHYMSTHTDVRFTHGICPECLANQRAKMKNPAA